MLPSLADLTETHLIGPGCNEWVLDQRRVPALKTAKLVWVGHSVLRPPYRMMRPWSPYSHVVACFGGRGRVRLAGAEVDFIPGQVLLAPVKQPHAFEIAGREPWRIAWVFFDDQKGPPAIAGDGPSLIRADSSDFVSALQLLTREASGSRSPALIQSLVTAVESFARRLAGPTLVDSRLWELWARVEGDLGHDWTVAELAKAVCMSEEHLRRLCLRQYQRSPMAHLTQLRMQRARILLRSSAQKLDVIAQQVGFADIYSFSNSFKRWNGVPPSVFRSQGE